MESNIFPEWVRKLKLPFSLSKRVNSSLTPVFLDFRIKMQKKNYNSQQVLFFLFFSRGAWNFRTLLNNSMESRVETLTAETWRKSGRRCSPLDAPAAIIYRPLSIFRGRAGPWFDLNLNFGRSYIHAGGGRGRGGGGWSSPRCFLALLPPLLALWTFIQWITSLVATFRGLLIPAGQIIQIGLLHSCPNLMSVMLLRTLRPRRFSGLSQFSRTHPLSLVIHRLCFAAFALAPASFGSDVFTYAVIFFVSFLFGFFFPLYGFKVASTWRSLAG